jgi:hypothetical protein
VEKVKEVRTMEEEMATEVDGFRAELRQLMERVERIS